VQPDTTVADSPTGLSVDLHIPQNENPAGFAEADLKKAVVTLPEGVTVNPSSANGLAACSPAQIDLEGSRPAQCPDASKLGTVEVDTPLVDHPLPGSVYLASQDDNPFGSLLAIYIAVYDPVTGVVVKLPGRVSADSVTGRLTTTFDNNPQLPFEDFKLDFFGGARAALMTPATCGTFQTTSALTPWSDPTTSTPANPSDGFAIGSGANGMGCVSSVAQSPFNPVFSAGTESAQAGAFSPFVLSFSRNDGEQRSRTLMETMPRGLLAKLAGVPLCSASDANAGDCPAGSQIGTVMVGAGAGPDLVFVTGRIFLTGPYGGGAFGEGGVVSGVAGPFNLGTVVVRGSIRIDPNTAQATVVSDPFPTIL